MINSDTPYIIYWYLLYIMEVILHNITYIYCNHILYTLYVKYACARAVYITIYESYESNWWWDTMSLCEHPLWDTLQDVIVGS